jgi:hypothetical protein
MMQRDAVRKLELDTASCESAKSDNPILHRESPLLKNRSDATGNFKNLRVTGVP